MDAELLTLAAELADALVRCLESSLPLVGLAFAVGLGVGASIRD